MHTTEFNVSDEENTLTEGDNVIYRRKDLSSLAHRLRLIGCGMEVLDDFPGTAPEDIEYDYHPFYQNDRAHIKLMLGGYVTTSCMIIITKGRYPGALPPMGSAPATPAPSLNWKVSAY